MARTFLRTAANYQIETFSDQCCAAHFDTNGGLPPFAAMSDVSAYGSK
ncbi:MAG: hypothetical protein HQ479_12675 [Rhodobacter sp.]|nr:hypothetical protein [Rhodobacter sp.]